VKHVLDVKEAENVI